MNEMANIVDIDEGNAQQLLIDESFNRPVVVDFVFVVVVDVSCIFVCFVR